VSLATDGASATVVQAHDHSLFKLVEVPTESIDELERVLLETCFVRQAPTVS
jgi:hypothetical protein